MPGFDARHATRRSRRVRVIVVLALAVALTAFLVVHFEAGSSGHARPPSKPVRKALHVPVVTSTLASWQLAAPVSRAVVLSGAAAGSPVPGVGPGQVVILGGSTTGGLEATGIFTLNVTDGALAQIGDLTGELDDAAGAVIGGRFIVFGGASPDASAAVQAFPAAGTTVAAPVSPGAPVPRSAVIATLPAPRAGATAVTVGATTFVVGGADGADPDSSVLATTDGTTFTTVASLPVPVQFPAVVAAGGRIYVFGGVAVTGPDAGHAVDSVQVVDLATHRVTTSGRLPEPLAAAAAVSLGGDILVAGGDTSSSVTAPSPTVSPQTTSAPGAASPGTAATSAASVSTVWEFEPASGRFLAVGHLQVPVSHAGVAVVGDTAWLVGGQSDATPVTAAQTIALSSGS
jgi:hypothetical protein